MAAVAVQPASLFRVIAISTLDARRFIYCRIRRSYSPSLLRRSLSTVPLDTVSLFAGPLSRGPLPFILPFRF